MARKVVEFGLDPRRVEHVPNFIDPGAYAVAERHGGYFVYAGRLERVKGVLTLLRAVRASPIAREHGLWIAGDGEQRRELEAFCNANGLGNVKFLGHLSQAELEPVLTGAMFAVVPSEWYENAPLSVLETSARGRAVIASDLGGLPEMVRHNETGLLFKAGDTAALSGALEQLLEDPGRTTEMGRKGRAFIEEAFNPQRHYEGLMKVYERALSGSASGARLEGTRT
jgi:glycosyltransferase involved in cell wall biosynthesis